MMQLKRQGLEIVQERHDPSTNKSPLSIDDSSTVKQSTSRYNGRCAAWHVRAIRTPEGPLRTVLQQTVSASTLLDVPLP
jgi:hypothetical protein